MSDATATALLADAIVDESKLQLEDPITIIYISVQHALQRLWVDNPKRHDVGGLAESVAKYGLQELPKFDVNLPSAVGPGAIKAGNGRIEALAALERAGTDKVPPGVGVHTETGEWVMPILIGTDAASLDFAKAYAMDSNNLTMAGGDFNVFDMASMWDEVEYTRMLVDMATRDTLPVTIDGDDVDALFREFLQDQDDAKDIPDPKMDRAAELQAVWGTALGQLWQLGEHRLIVGDSTDPEVIARLMQDRKSRMVWTDPPYNVDYGASKNHPSWHIRQIEGDKQSPEEWHAFVHAFGGQIKERNTGDAYVWGASGPDGMRMRLWLIEMGLHWSATIVWKKQQLVLSPAKYQRMYEPCLYGWFGSKSSFIGDRKQREVWEVDRPTVSPEHPTMKPVELALRAIRNSSRKGDGVLDLFFGSGPHFVACEKLGRVAYGADIEPKYAAVAIQRWVDMTGGEPVLLGAE
jgi:DNA modification methylase